MNHVLKERAVIAAGSIHHSPVIVLIALFLSSIACGDLAGQTSALSDVQIGNDAGYDSSTGSGGTDGATGIDSGGTTVPVDPIIWDDSLKDGWIEPEPGECESIAVRAFIQYTPDGDTIHLTSGERVRMLGVSASELSNSECYSNEGKESLIALAQKGTEICLLPDPKADNKDRYDRLLRYVFVPHADDGRWVLANARLVRTGKARAYTSFLWGLRYRNEIVAAEFEARSEDIGGWADCGWQPR